MDPEKTPLTPMISPEELAQQADDLMAQAAEMQERAHEARRQAQALLASVGEELPSAVREELGRFTGSEQPDYWGGHAEGRRVESKGQALELLSVIVPADGRRTVSKKRDVDLDMGGGYDEIRTWDIVRTEGVTLLESNTRHVGYRASRGNFDETTTRTFVVNEALHQPLVFDGVLERLSQAGVARRAALRLTDWSALLPELREAHQKVHAEQLADECNALLGDAVFEPGRWSGVRVRRLVAEDSSGANRWHLSQAVYEGGTGDRFFLSHLLDGETKMSVWLETNEGTFDSYAYSNAKELFVQALHTIKTLSSQTP